MTSEFFTLKLQTAIEALSVEGVNDILSTFSCNLNDDIERFLKEKSIGFSNKGIARTHLVLFDSGSGLELMGYYTLTNKILSISPEGLSNSTKKRVERFGVLDSHTNTNDKISLIRYNSSRCFFRGATRARSGKFCSLQKHRHV